MSAYFPLYELLLGDKYQPTGKTVHRKGAEIVALPYKLEIAQYPSDDGFYLFHFDQQGRELTDTYHDDLSDAFAQAEWEFGVKRGAWSEVDK